MRPNKYNSFVKKNVVLVTLRMNKRGDVFYLCEYDDEGNYVCFENMSSVIDFLKSNF